MNKYIIVGVIAVLVVIGGYALTRHAAVPTEVAVAAPTDTVASSSPVTDPSSQTPIKALTPWSAFQTYLTAAKNHDLATLKTVSYQLSAACKDDSQREKCNTLMSGAYEAGKDLKQSDFTVVWSDSRQVIMSTPYVRHENTETIGYIRGIVYFVLDGGVPKVLSFNPTQGAYLSKKDQTTAAVEAALAATIKDADKDGKDDEVEMCVGEGSGCVKTDPTKRDTNGNGYWDGIEALFR